MSELYSKIIRDPLTRTRQGIADDFYGRKLDDNRLKEIADELAAIDPAKTALVGREHQKAAQALGTGASPETPDLTDPLTATLWGATLATLAVKTGAVHRLPVWKQAVDHPVIQRERQESAYELYRSFRKVGFNDFKVTVNAPADGYPSIAYYCNLDDKVVNLDPLWMLVLGVEKARSGMMHEVAHALGTLSFPPSMQKLRDEMEAIKKNPQATDDDKLRFTALNIEWQHRFYLADEAENSYANRFVINRGQSGSENYGQSLNYIESVFGSIASTAAKIAATKEKPGAKERFFNLKRAIRLSLFKNNGLFPDTPAGWRSIGVEPDWIEEVGASPKKGFKALQSLAALTRNMEELQPRPGEMIHGADAFKAKNKECWLNRMDIVDQLYDRFAAPLVDELKKEAEQNQKKKQEQKKEDKKKQDKKDKPEKNDKPQEKKEKEEKEEKEKEEKEEGQQCQNPQPQDGEGEAEGQSCDKDGGKSKGKKKDAKKEKKGEEKQEEKKPEKKPPKPENSGEEEAPAKPGHGEPQPGKPEEGERPEEMKLPPQSPQDMNKPADQPPDGTPPEESPTVSELVDQKEQEQAQEAEDGIQKPFQDAGQKMGGTAQPPDGQAPPQPQQPRKAGPVDLNEYEKLVELNRSTIACLEKSIRQIMERQTITTRTPSPDRTLVPQDGNPARMDTRKLERTLSGLASGKVPRLSDFKNFKVDGRKNSTAPEMDIEIIIDVSGSLTGKPFERAIAAAVSLYEAARKIKGVNVSITAMGMPEPTPLARPGQTTEEISTKILQIRQAMGSGQDFLSPAVGEMLARHAINRNGPQQKAGMTHTFVISDGLFNDGPFALAAAQVLGGMAAQLTADFLILRSGDRDPPILETVRQMNAAGKKNIALRTSPGDGQVGEALICMVEDRLKNIKPGEAVAREVKQDRFQKALKEMQRRMMP